jgi:expansin (peptidoglycan-binding protein)
MLNPNGTDDGGLVTYGQAYSGGQYNLGPVDWSESQYHNACAPSGMGGPTKYISQVSSVEGTLLAGLWGGIANTDSFCDSCIWVTTPKGKSAMLRVVTYGTTSMNSIDVSQTAFDILNVGEYPRPMTWVSAKCPDTGAMLYEFKHGANEYWTSLWVRNARVPLQKVEVESPNHKTWFALSRVPGGQGDGSLTDGNGFGQGSFTIRSTGVDGQTVTDTFDWPSGGVADALLTGKGNFH